MSVVVLFGAGASYGAGGVSPSVPPLGTNLYYELATMFPSTWGNCDASLAKQFTDNFEEGMGALWDSGSHDVPLLMQGMAKFFSYYQIYNPAENAYCRLFNKIIALDKTVRFSSLNYDCLLEFAVGAIGRIVNYFSNEPESASETIVWKLHGSCNFLPGDKAYVSRSSSYGSGGSINPGIKITTQLNKVVTYCNSDTSLYPAMAIYAHKKPIQIASPEIKMVQGFWTDAINSASTVVVIGVHPIVADKHIWDPLSRTGAKLLYVGGEKPFLDWESKYRKDQKTLYLGERFESSIEAIVENL